MKASKTYPLRSRDIIWRVLDEETFLMSKDGSQIHVLNKTGCLAWKLSDGHTKVEDISSKVAEKFDVDYSTAQRDVLDFFQDLGEKELAQLRKNPIEDKPST